MVAPKPSTPTLSGVHASLRCSCWPSAGVPALPVGQGAWLPWQGRTGAQLPTLTCSVSVLRELQEREKALRLQKERLQRELEEKKRKVTGGRACGSRGLCTELWAGAAWPQWFGQELLCLPGCAGVGAEEGSALPWSVTSCLLLSPGPRKSSSVWLSSGCRRNRRRRPRRPRLPAIA